ncbi:MAG TPA: NAD-dependent epimerase/dehydratase family protein, partial [Actinomycetota bacterium]|nr:NAD-dependent epimerase/dehydratase family protein [Actinomycetota bacterium]
MMNILVLGGTIFLGRHIVEAARAAGHTVTLFNRGRSNPGLFEDVERLVGDRAGDLSALEGRTWDAVIDTCGYFPRLVRKTSELLAGSVHHHVFISSISAYEDVSRPGMDETTPVGRLDDPTTEEITGDTYGPLKVLCEEAVEEAAPGRALIVRPGLIVGPHDPTDRFTYWPRRIAKGGRYLAPGSPDRGVQVIDARDLARWIIHCVERRTTGVFNATGPQHPIPIGELFETARRESGSDASPVWVVDDFLTACDVVPWMGLPLWLPDEPDSAGFMAVSVERAVAAGLTFRPISETIRDTLEWDRERGEPPLRAGISEDEEVEL